MPESRFARCEDLVTWSRIRMQASLRWHLTYWLIGPLLLLVTAGNLVSFPIALNPATKADDRALLHPVLALARHLSRPGAPPPPNPPSIAIPTPPVQPPDRAHNHY